MLSTFPKVTFSRTDSVLPRLAAEYTENFPPTSVVSKTLRVAPI